MMNRLRLVSVSELLLTTSFVSSVNPSNLKEKCPYPIADHILHNKSAAAESAQNCQRLISTSSICCDTSTMVDCNSFVKTKKRTAIKHIQKESTITNAIPGDPWCPQRFVLCPTLHNSPCRLLLAKKWTNRTF